MLDAPNEKPKRGWIHLPPNSSEKLSKRIDKAATPRRPKPTTLKPMTAPLENATLSAAPRLVRAASVVRTALLVATRMPMKPAEALATEPITKAPAVHQPPPSRRKTPIATATT